MGYLNKGMRGITGEVARIRAASAKIESRLAELRPNEEARIGRLTAEELQDLSKVVGIADFMVCKYAENRDMLHILRDFAGVISAAADSLGSIDDEMSEIILSAEDSLGRVKEMHTRISEGSDLRDRHERGSSPLNLTNIDTVLNPSKYQQNPQGQAVR